MIDHVVLAHETAKHVSFLNDYWSVVSDKAHMAAEATWEVVTGLIVYPFGRFAARRHDRKHHGG